MRITIAQGAFLPVPPLRGGAIEKAWDALAREFSRRGHTVTQISRLCDGLPPLEESDGVNRIRINGYEMPLSMFLIKWRDLLYARRVCGRLPPADILVTHTFWLPVLLHDPSRGRVCVHVARYPKGQMWLYRRTARLQAISQAVADAIVQQTPSCARLIKVLPLPLPEGAWESSPRPDDRREPVVLYAGRIHPEKGLDLLAAAWTHPRARNALAGWKLVLAGPWAVAQGGGGEEYRAQLAAKFSAAGDSVEWTGPLFGADTAKLHDLYRRARLFVYPSIAERGEALGLAPLEAMAAGAPAIVSDLGCFRDYLRDGENGLVFDHRGPDAGAHLAASLATLAENPARRAALAAAAWQTASHFRVEEVATRYLNDFESILTTPPA